MNEYQRVFGTGPRGLAISLALGGLAYLVAPVAPLPPAVTGDAVRGGVLAVAVILAGALGFWGVRFLPPSGRGCTLVTAGAYRFFRHPLYASLLTFFNFGLAVWLGDWIFVAWAVLLHPIWHWNVRAEERLMRDRFGEAYDAYAASTGRFFPRIFRARASGASPPAGGTNQPG